MAEKTTAVKEYRAGTKSWEVAQNFLQLRRNHDSVEEIAEKLGCGVSLVYKVIENYFIPKGYSREQLLYVADCGNRTRGDVRKSNRRMTIYKSNPSSISAKTAEGENMMEDDQSDSYEKNATAEPKAEETAKEICSDSNEMGESVPNTEEKENATSSKSHATSSNENDAEDNNTLVNNGVKIPEIFTMLSNDIDRALENGMSFIHQIITED